MGKRLFLLLATVTTIMWCTAGGAEELLQNRITPTSAFSREALTNKTAAQWRAKLGVSGNGAASDVAYTNDVGIYAPLIVQNGYMVADTNMLAAVLASALSPIYTNGKALYVDTSGNDST